MAEADRKRQRVSYNSSCWTTVTAGMALQMLHERTGREQYLESIRLSTRYLKGLQVLDPRHPRRGMFFHNIPQDETVGPNRDGTTTAWGLLNFSRALRDDDLLDRALAYAKCYARFRFSKRHRFPLYPLDSTGGVPKAHACHGGELIPFLELYEHTGDARWLTQIAVPGLDTYAEVFVNPDGSLKQLYDFRNKKEEDWIPKPGALPDRRHAYNDDFGSLALMKGFRITGDRKYLDAAKRFLDWAARQQHEDGSFGEPKVYNDATPVLIIEMLDMQALLRKPVYASCIKKAVKYLLSLQVKDTGKPQAHGGFFGLSPWVKMPRCCVQLRTSGYALAALLKMENKRVYSCYSAAS